MEYSRKSVFKPIWSYELKTKGKWVLTDFDDDYKAEKSQSDAENFFSKYFGKDFVDGIIAFSSGVIMDDDGEDACEIIVKESPKAEPIRYLFSYRGKEEEVEWITIFKLRTRKFPPKLYAD